MSFTYINKIILLILFTFVISCQNKFNYFVSNNNDKIQENVSINQNLKQKIDLSLDYIESNIIDYYSNEFVEYDFLQRKINKIKINNFDGNYINNFAINSIYKNSYLFSVNSKGELLKLDSNTGKLIEKFLIGNSLINKTPISLSLIDNNFLIGFNSGEIIKFNDKGEIIWSYKKNSLLNTPIKYFNNNLIILYPEDIVILSNEDGDIIYEKKYTSSNIIQSSGGKVLNYFNIIFFILPNSEFISLDTLLLEENTSNLDNLRLNTSINNLNDNIYLYNDLFVYLDNGNILNTFDISLNKFILSDYKIKNVDSYQFYNNTFITKNDKSIKFYNIEDGILLLNLDTYKLLKKESKLIKIININEKLHLFTDYGQILILDNSLNFINVVDLNIRKINKIFNYQQKFLISTQKGITYILK